MNVLGICGSLRRQSKNMGMLRYAQSHTPNGMTLEIADLSDLPFYNEDITQKSPAVIALLDQMARADALLLSCPEYNYSIAPALKNALDWGSREPDNALLSGKAAAIMGAGGGMGTSRAQYHLRQVGVFLNLHFVNQPEVFCNAFAAGTFDDDGNLTDERIQHLIDQQLVALQTFSQKLA
ncbi:MAG: NADPH-dependent FMN reductase [Hydrogenovibrio sp.]|nr:NADPH-dependent FMN reductase [Hydrogenovibrio sp.]